MTAPRHGRLLFLVVALALVFGAPPPASAQIALNRIILDFSGEQSRQDIEIVNNGEDTAFIVVEPARIEQPGSTEEQRITARDPNELGLLVTPNRLVLEPGERKLVRIAVIEPAAVVDRIYRVTVKPVLGEVRATETSLKLLVGYDVLVIVRPGGAAPDLNFQRQGRRVIVTNNGNTNALLSEGRQCDPSGGNCTDLPSKRLYAGARWELELETDAPAEYYVSSGGGVTVAQF
jgi:P pilus assembly chaperone PapD